MHELRMPGWQAQSYEDSNNEGVGSDLRLSSGFLL
jgi:hypothetical protein